MSSSGHASSFKLGRAKKLGESDECRLPCATTALEVIFCGARQPDAGNEGVRWIASPRPGCADRLLGGVLGPGTSRAQKERQAHSGRHHDSRPTRALDGSAVSCWKLELLGRPEALLPPSLPSPPTISAAYRARRHDRLTPPFAVSRLSQSPSPGPRPPHGLLIHLPRAVSAGHPSRSHRPPRSPHSLGPPVRVQITASGRERDARAPPPGSPLFPSVVLLALATTRAPVPSRAMYTTSSHAVPAAFRHPSGAYATPPARPLPSAHAHARAQPPSPRAAPAPDPYQAQHGPPPPPQPPQPFPAPRMSISQAASSPYPGSHANPPPPPLTLGQGPPMQGPSVLQILQTGQERNHAADAMAHHPRIESLIKLAKESEATWLQIGTLALLPPLCSGQSDTKPSMPSARRRRRAADDPRDVMRAKLTPGD